MTDIEIRHEIAKFCGATHIIHETAIWSKEWHHRLLDLRCRPMFSEENVGMVYSHIPDFPNDLNAIWEAVEHGGPKLVKAMRFELYDICGQMRAHHATAREQCRGLLQHLGKWKE